MKYDEKCDGVVDYSGFFGGDIGAEQEQAIAASGQVGHVDLLKVSHHGSKYSSNEQFLSVLSPDVAVISCAKKNRYGHPSEEALSRLEDVGTIYRVTAWSGAVLLELDGDVVALRGYLDE